MKYVIFHFRTGGFNSYEHSIIEVAAIIEDTKNKLDFETIPKYRTLIYNEIYKGDPLALYLNRDTLKEINDAIKNNLNTIVHLDMLALDLYTWLSKHIDTHIDDSNYMQDFNSFGKNYSSEGVIKSNKKPKLLINVGGKNFGTFDLRFLENLEGFSTYIKFHQRVIDPAVFYFNNSIDKELPNLSICKERAGIQNTEIAHRTIKDAWDIIQVLRGKMYPKIHENSKDFDFSILK